MTSERTADAAVKTLREKAMQATIAVYKETRGRVPVADAERLADRLASLGLDALAAIDALVADVERERARADRAEAALRDVAVLLRQIPFKAEYAGVVTASVYMALSLIEDTLGIPDDDRGTAPGQYDRAALSAGSGGRETTPCPGLARPPRSRPGERRASELSPRPRGAQSGGSRVRAIMLTLIAEIRRMTTP